MSSFTMRLTEDRIRIADSGGGFVLDASMRSTEDLVRIADAGSKLGARLHFRGLTMRSTDDLIRIANAGKGCVQFEG